LSYKYKVIRIAAGSKRVCGCVKQSAWYFRPILIKFGVSP
jgi:hypothetical protein